MFKTLVFCLTFICIVGCGGSSNNQPAQTSSADQPTTPSKHVWYDGTYLFDTGTYKSVQLSHDDSLFKNMKPEDVDKMMRIFQPFKIEVNGDDVMATFSQDIIKGKLQKLSTGSSEARLFMKPVDEDKRDQTVTLIIRGEELVLDPGKKETDKMFFRREAVE